MSTEDEKAEIEYWNLFCKKPAAQDDAWKSGESIDLEHFFHWHIKFSLINSGAHFAVTDWNDRGNPVVRSWSSISFADLQEIQRNQLRFKVLRDETLFSDEDDSEESFAGNLENKMNFSSIMKSKRRFNHLQFGKNNSYDKLTGLRLKRLGQFLERFGKEIKKLYIGNIEFPPNFDELLNFMPKLEKIELWGVLENSWKRICRGALRLHKLKKLECEGCDAAVVLIFNLLPPGVLEEIWLKEF